MTILLFQSDTEAPALTTLDEVRQYLNVPPTDTVQDDLLNGLIVQASRAIMRDTQREFSPAANGLTRVFGWDGGPHLDLTPYDLRNATSITLDPDLATPTVLAATDYRVGPLPASDGVYEWISLRHAGAGGWWYGHRHRGRDWQRQIQIVGDWGWPVVPADVERACVLTVKVWYERDVAGFSRTYGADETLLARPLPLPNAATELLAPYKTLVLA